MPSTASRTQRQTRMKWAEKRPLPCSFGPENTAADLSSVTSGISIAGQVSHFPDVDCHLLCAAPAPAPRGRAFRLLRSPAPTLARAAGWVFVVGALATTQGGVNVLLAQALRSPYPAAFTSVFVSFLLLAGVCTAQAHFGAPGKPRSMPKLWEVRRRPRRAAQAPS